MLLEDAIIKLTEHEFDVLIRHNLDNIGYIHLIKDNTTRVLYYFDELIKFAERLK